MELLYPHREWPTITGDKLEVAAHTPNLLKSLELVIDCYECKVKEVQDRLQKAEAWMVKVK